MATVTCDRTHIGRRAEEIAAQTLREAGWKIAARNFKEGRHELDIVGEGPGRELLFVEVRSSRTAYLSTPAITVNREKQARIVSAARKYLHRHGRHDWNVRFDVIAVAFDDDNAVVEWYEDAFRPPPSATNRTFMC